MLLSKEYKIYLIEQINENDSIDPDLGNKNGFEFLEKNNPFLNSNFLLSPLTNNHNNNDDGKELDNLTNPLIPTSIDRKSTYHVDLPSLNNSNDKYNNLFFKDKVNSEDQKTKNDLKTHKTRTGRLKKGEKKVGMNCQYKYDNIRRKVKHLVLKSIMKFLNIKLKIIYNGNIGNSILKKEFLALNKNPKFESSIEYNKLFLKKTLKEILSENISTRFTSYNQDFNKKLIEKLINEEDKEKRDYFIKLFNLTFADCLQHFNRTKIIKELDGMESIDDVLEEFNNEKEYKEILYYNIKNFEDIINSKQSRTSKKMKEKKTKNENNNFL